MEQEWAVGLRSQGKTVILKIRRKTFGKSGRRASGPREEKLKLKFGKEFGVIVGGGPLGPGRKSLS